MTIVHGAASRKELKKWDFLCLAAAEAALLLVPFQPELCVHTKADLSCSLIFPGALTL